MHLTPQEADILNYPYRRAGTSRLAAPSKSHEPSLRDLGKRAVRTRTARLLFACALGASATLALPPFHLLPLVFVAMSGLLWATERSRSWAGALLVGWSFGFGYFLSGLHWIGNSFYVDAEQFGPLAVPAVLTLSAALALFPAVACVVARALRAKGVYCAISFAACWSLTEWLRGTLLGGFPWNLIGYVWTIDPAPLQLVAATGIYGVSFVTVLIATLPALAFTGNGASLRRPARWLLVASMAGVLVLWGGGAVRLQSAAEGEVPGIQLRIVQPNIPQSVKWRRDRRDEVLRRHLELSTRSSETLPTHIIWPETAVPYMLIEDTEAREAIADMLRGASLLTGTVRRGEAAGSRSQVFNSLVAIAPTGLVEATYDKTRLVPFGEFVPLRGLLPFRKLAVGSTDFSAGRSPRSIELSQLPPFQPLICYEAIFPGDLPQAGPRPRWLLNVTNDAWFGSSAGPYQHFQMARVRAIERGVPLVRAANTGISAVVDPYGRIRTALPLGTEGIIDARLPRHIEGGTIFTRLGNAPFFAMVFIGLIGPRVRRKLI